MTGKPKSPEKKLAPTANDGQDSDRRSSLELRELIDQMLARVRDIHRNNPRWDPSERARAEADLEAIMARVRRETVRSGLNEEANADSTARISGTKAEQ